MVASLPAWTDGYLYVFVKWAAPCLGLGVLVTGCQWSWSSGLPCSAPVDTRQVGHLFFSFLVCLPVCPSHVCPLVGQCVLVCPRVGQCVLVCPRVGQCVLVCQRVGQCVLVCQRVGQCVLVCQSVDQYVLSVLASVSWSVSVLDSVTWSASVLVSVS